MAFSEETVEKAFKQAGGKCKCRRSTHVHSYGVCAISNWCGKTEGEKAEELGKHTILTQTELMVLLTVKFFAGSVTKAPVVSAVNKSYQGGSHVNYWRKTGERNLYMHKL